MKEVPVSALRVSSSGGLQPGGVASYDTQAEAEHTISYLVSQGVANDQLMLVGTGMRMVVPPAPPSPVRRVLVTGAGAGLLCGLGLAIVLWWFLPAVPLYEVIGWCLISGVVYGVLASLVVYVLMHDDTARTQSLRAVATRFDVMADESIAARARNLLVEAEQAEEGWQALETPQPVETVDPRVWSRGAGATTSTTEAVATETPSTEPAIPEVPRIKLPAVPRTVLPQTLAYPNLPAHAARALPGDAPAEETDMESTAARRYSFDL
jgi:hypothetical protein